MQQSPRGAKNESCFEDVAWFIYKCAEQPLREKGLASETLEISEVVSAHSLATVQQSLSFSCAHSLKEGTKPCLGFSWTSWNNKYSVLKAAEYLTSSWQREEEESSEKMSARATSLWFPKRGEMQLLDANCELSSIFKGFWGWEQCRNVALRMHWQHEGLIFSLSSKVSSAPKQHSRC